MQLKTTSKSSNGQPFKVVANLPYAITTPWLESIIKDPLPQGWYCLFRKRLRSEYSQTMAQNLLGYQSLRPINL